MMTSFSRRNTVFVPLRNVLAFVRRRWRAGGRRFALAVALLLLVTMLPLMGLLWLALQQPAHVVSDPHLAPSMSVHIFPFRDLCEGVAATDAATNTTSALAARGNTTPQLSGDALSRLRSRLRHIPADGGVAGLRWSTATGLALPAHRTGREVAARFVTLSTRMDDFLQAAATAAAMAGVPLDVVGVGWKWFAFARRMELIRSYLDQEGVADEDVIVCMDVDAVLSGEDVYDTLAAFVASTAASVREHETYAVRDIRLGRRQPPVIFSAEYNCMHAQAYPSRHLCPTGYDVIDEMMETWSQQAGVALPAEHRRRNPLRFLNAGVVVGRVWALRRVWAAARAFMATHTYHQGEEWWCDQSVLGSLYLQLRWWEIASGALDAATPHIIDEATLQKALFLPLVVPDPRRGPHGLPGGLVGLDHAARFGLVISMHMEPKGVLQIGGVPTTHHVSPETALSRYLNTAGRLEEGLVATLRSSHRLELVPRRGVDCGAEDTPASRPPDCAYRAAVLGVPDGDVAVAPLVWHFAGKTKRLVLTRFRVIFPWYTPMLWNGTMRKEVLGILSASPPTRLWYINATTDLPFGNVEHALSPHRVEDDVSFQQLCTLSTIQY